MVASVTEKPLLRSSLGMSQILSSVTDSVFAGGSIAKNSNNNLPPFLRMVEDGRIDDVRLMLQIDKSVAAQERDNEGRTAMERMPADVNKRSIAQKQIIDLLNLYQ